MPSPAEMVQVLLSDQNLVILPPNEITLPGDDNVACFINHMPNAPDDCVSCYDTAGMTFSRIFRTGKTPIHYGVKIIRRSGSPYGYDLLRKIADFFDTGTLSPITLRVRDSACYLHTIHRRGDVIALGEEPDTRLWFWSLNINVVLRDTETSPLVLNVE